MSSISYQVDRLADDLFKACHGTLSASEARRIANEVVLRWQQSMTESEMMESVLEEVDRVVRDHNRDTLNHLPKDRVIAALNPWRDARYGRSPH